MKALIHTFFGLWILLAVIFHFQKAGAQIPYINNSTIAFSNSLLRISESEKKQFDKSLDQLIKPFFLHESSKGFGEVFYPLPKQKSLLESGVPFEEFLPNLLKNPIVNDVPPYTNFNTTQKQLFNKISAILPSQSSIHGNELSDIRDEIYSMPPSLEKIALLISYGNVHLQFNDASQFLSSINLTMQEVADEIRTILNPETTARAKILLGLFAVKHGFFEKAVTLYYEAKEMIYSSTLPSSNKNNLLGDLELRIAGAFSAFPSNSIYVTKESEYIESAIQYFAEAQNKIGINEATAMLLAVQSALLPSHTPVNRFFPPNELGLKLFCIKLLPLLSNYNKNIPDSSGYRDYATLYAIGSLLSETNHNDDALSYFIEAFLVAYQHQNSSLINASLSIILFESAKLGRMSIYSKIPEIKRLYNKQRKNELERLATDIDESVSKIILKKYIDANNQLTTFFVELNSLKTVSPFNVVRLTNDALNAKLILFSETRNKDSILAYSSFKKQYEELLNNSFFELFQDELLATNRFLETVKNKQVQDEQKSKHLTQFIAALLIVLFVALIIFINNKYKRKKEENKRIRIQNKAEYESINRLAQNKLHNLISDFEKIFQYIDDGNIAQLSLYLQTYSTYVSLFYENWKQPSITLKDEIELFNAYKAIFELTGFQINTVISNNDILPESTLFIQSILDTLLDNTVRRGFKRTPAQINFDIHFTLQHKSLVCIVSDNGTPPQDETMYLQREQSGLWVMRRRIELLWKVKELDLPVDFFCIERLPGKTGTRVSLKIPYEKTS